jgi:hypothetical protein
MIPDKKNDSMLNKALLLIAPLFAEHITGVRRSPLFQTYACPFWRILWYVHRYATSGSCQAINADAASSADEFVILVYGSGCRRNASLGSVLLPRDHASNSGDTHNIQYVLRRKAAHTLVTCQPYTRPRNK